MCMLLFLLPKKSLEVILKSSWPVNLQIVHVRETFMKIIF